MAEDIKGLIEKIQQEGIKAAQDQARKIQEEAEHKAKEIIAKAKIEAENIILAAKEDSAKIEESTKASIRQAGRDVLLSLRKEINAMLDKLIAQRLREALSPQELSKIIAELIKHYKDKTDTEVIVSLQKEDLEKLEKGFLGDLREEIKKKIVLNPSEDIQAGFIISYDAGKSHFDFTDKALVEYIGSYIRPKLNQILNEALEDDK